MELNPKHNNHLSDKDIRLLIQSSEIPYSRTKEEIWGILENNLMSEQKPAFYKSHLTIIRTIAAGILILIGVVSFLRFYEKTISNPYGMQMTAWLPDGSSALLNGGTTLRFHPYWFSISRNIEFEGEGFFQVAKGSTFSVESKLGKTIVLGTSFNVFSRNENYTVQCYSGTVKIISNSNDEAILKPGYMATLEQNKKLKVEKISELQSAPGWTEKMFSFTGTRLTDVIEEISRHYNVVVEYDTIPEFYYTGYFEKEKQIEEVLILIVKPFGLNYVKISDKHFKLTQN